MHIKPIRKERIPRSSWGGERQRRIPESLLAEEAVTEFIEGGYEAAEIEIPEKYDAQKVCQASREAAWKLSDKHEAARDMRAIKRGHRVFLEKVDRSGS